jgi:hypothetical protein
MVTSRRANASSDLHDHVLIRAKSNVGPGGDGFEYALESTELRDASDISTSRVAWGQAVRGNARDLLARAETINDPAGQTAVAEFVKEFLEGGPKPSHEVLRAARDRGISSGRLQRVATAIGVKKRKVGMTGGWIWSLEERGAAPEDIEDDQSGGLESSPSSTSLGAAGESSEANPNQHREAAAP